ncbi:MAG: DUF1819 family protein [Acidobacteria bacterium]|nr:DUF1819 family protein [Acidobacteriota bacterium]
MRQMVALWSEELSEKDPVAVLARHIPKTTMVRLKDTFTRAFRPRFIQGSPPNAWRLAKVLGHQNADLHIIRPFYYWITARSETTLYSFVTEVVYARSRSPEREIRIEEAISWLSHQLTLAGKTWTPTVVKKVSRGMMAALRDFGILEGATRKKVSSINLFPDAFTLIAFCLNEMGATGRDLIKHPDWRLFLLGENGVENLFLECHQHGWLKFESAGNMWRTEFPAVSFEDYAHGVIG